MSIHNNKAPARSPKRFFYGWIMLPVAALGFFVTSPAQTYGVSLFNDSLRGALDLTHSRLSGAYMFGTLLGAIPMGYVGALMDRHGLRRTMSVIVLLLGLTCIFMSQVGGLFTLFLGFFMLRMLGPGAQSMLSGTILPFWFSKRLGTAEGLRHMGMAGGMALFPALVLCLLESVGWRWAYAILGMGIMAVMFPVMAFVFKNRPEDVGQQMDGLEPGEPPFSDRHARRRGGVDFTLGRALSTRAFWICAAAIGMWAMINTGVQFNLVPIFETRGMGREEVSLVFRSYALVLMVLYLPCGYLADRLPLNLMLSMAMIGLAFVAGMVIITESLAGVYLLGGVLGAAQAIAVPTLTTLLPRYYGLMHLGKIRGGFSTLLVASSSAGPFIIGFSYDMLGGYGQVLTAMLLMPLPLIPLALFATPPGQPE